MGRSKKAITSKEFDKKFENNEEISEYLDWDNAIKKINVDFPLWMVKALDEESNRLQIPRQAVIKMWIDEKLQFLNQQHVRLKEVSGNTKSAKPVG